ncbi:MAG TPA: hypothetical protein VH760_02215 [Gaiellaceae bacterium]|jgi:hypothetical protein
MSEGQRRLLVVASAPQVRRLPELYLELLGRDAELVFSTDALPSSLGSRPSVTTASLPLEREGADAAAVGLLRTAADLVRFLDPELEHGAWPRRRAARRLLKLAGHRRSRAIAQSTSELRLSPETHARLRGGLRQLERLIPPQDELVEAIGALDVDAVLLVSRCLLGGPEPDVLKAARVLGLPSILLVWSWDNLSSKAVLNEHPDRLVVWNDVQAREAVELHGVDPGHIDVLGAANFDRFFEELDAARRRSGAPSSPRPKTILYLGSSAKIAPREVPIFERWLEAVRASADPAVRDANVVVRPHPAGRGWESWTPPERVRLELPTAKLEPVTLAELLLEADAAVALNTSAELEAAIAGVPVLTFRAGNEARGQEGSVHFWYLLEGRGGFVLDAATLDEHVARLGDALAGGRDAASARAVERFVRPAGMTHPVVPAVASSVLEAARLEPAPPAPSLAPPPAAIRAGRSADGTPRILVVAPRDHVHALPEVFLELLDAGTRLLFADRNTERLARAVERLEHPGAQVVELPMRRTGDEADALELLRAAGDLLLLFHPELATAAWARVRAARRLLKAAGVRKPGLAAERLADAAVPPAVQATLSDALRQLERLVPPAPALCAALEELAVDAVLLVSRCSIRGPEPEVLKAARRLGLPSSMLVYSWDNLSSKAVLNEHPDRLLVWNDLQTREAVSFHGLEQAQVGVVGAANFDRFFEELALAEQTSGEARAAPTILYLGSSKASADEPAIVGRWLQSLRASQDPLVRDAVVIVRPHPGSNELWEDWQPPADPLLSVRFGAKGDRASLARALRAADAAVALSTTAEIEAAIAGRPVLTFRAGADAPAQDGLRHFYYLLEEHGGFVVDAPTLGEHVPALERVLHGDYDAGALGRFVGTFVRPRGVEQRVAPLVASAVLELLPLPAAQAVPASG